MKKAEEEEEDRQALGEGGPAEQEDKVNNIQLKWIENVWISLKYSCVLLFYFQEDEVDQDNPGAEVGLNL